MHQYLYLAAFPRVAEFLPPQAPVFTQPLSSFLSHNRQEYVQWMKEYSELGTAQSRAFLPAPLAWTFHEVLLAKGGKAAPSLLGSQLTTNNGIWNPAMLQGSKDVNTWKACTEKRAHRAKSSPSGTLERANGHPWDKQTLINIFITFLMVSISRLSTDCCTCCLGLLWSPCSYKLT